MCDVPRVGHHYMVMSPPFPDRGVVDDRFEPHIKLIEIFRPKWKQYQKQTHFREKNEKIENLPTFVLRTNVIKRNFYVVSSSKLNAESNAHNHFGLFLQERPQNEDVRNCVKKPENEYIRPPYRTC